jgi:RNA ligase (TIGR02306 family)
MSTFAVEVVRLDDVLPHTNADALELAVIGGSRAVVQKGIHKKGDLALYIPEDAVLPADVIDAFGFTGKLAGRRKNRVKAIRLRGELSQGLVIPVEKAISLVKTNERFWPYVEANPDFSSTYEEQPIEGAPFTETIAWFDEGADFAAALGIEKYEEPIPVEMAGRQRSRPSWFPTYTDIENIKRYNRALVEGETVVLTEKIHGTNFGAGMLASDREMLVSSRRIVLERDETNLYWRAAALNRLEANLNLILDATGAQSAVIFGEVFGPGVQDLTYGVMPGAIEFRAFDIMLDGEYVSYPMFLELVGAEAEPVEDDEGNVTALAYYSAIPMVPPLYYGAYSPEIVAQYTDGKDTLSGSHVREGVVIRPEHERRSGNLGRVILKSVSADYLLRKNGTERH